MPKGDFVEMGNPRLRGIMIRLNFLWSSSPECPLHYLSIDIHFDRARSYLTSLRFLSKVDPDPSMEYKVQWLPSSFPVFLV